MAVVDLRYARALDEVVSEKSLPRDQVRQQLEVFLETYTDSSELREVLANPSIAQQQKVRVLDALSARLGLNPTIRNFLAVLTQNQRLSELKEVLEAYLARADQGTGVADAEITTARPVDEGERRLLEDSILRLSGSNTVRAIYKQDTALLGGAMIRVGSTVYDGSVRGQLEQMRQRMLSATM